MFFTEDSIKANVKTIFFGEDQTAHLIKDSEKFPKKKYFFGKDQKAHLIKDLEKL